MQEQSASKKHPIHIDAILLNFERILHQQRKAVQWRRIFFQHFQTGKKPCNTNCRRASHRLRFVTNFTQWVQPCRILHPVQLLCVPRMGASTPNFDDSCLSRLPWTRRCLLQRDIRDFCRSNPCGNIFFKTILCGFCTHRVGGKSTQPSRRA